MEAPSSAAETTAPGAIAVAHLTTVHPPTDTRILHKMCVSAAQHGVSVALLARHPLVETLEGVRVLPLPGSRSRSRWTRFFRSLWDGWRGVREHRPRIVHFHDPELIPLGIVLRLCGAKVIYDVHEDLPSQTLSKHYLPRWARPAVAYLCGLVEALGVRFMSGIVAATPHIARRFPPGKTILVQNFPLAQELVVPSSVAYGERPPYFAYVGVVSAIRGVREMVAATAEVGSPEVRLRVAGKFSPEGLRAETEKMPGWDRTIFHPWLARGELAELLGKVRAGLVLFHPEPNHVAAQPNKIFEYMSAGLPVIASNFPLWRDIVEGSGCGLCVDPLDARAIAGAMEWILSHSEEAAAMGERGRRAVQETYNWPREAERLVALYRRILDVP